MHESRRNSSGRSIAIATATALLLGAGQADGARPVHGFDVDGGVPYIVNQGQLGPPGEILFQFRDGPVTGYVTRDALWLDRAVPAWDDDHPGRTGPPLTAQRTALRVTFAGASRPFAAEPIGEPVMRVSYFLGSDASRWARAVPAYTGVRLVGLYDGLDLELGGRGGRFAWRADAREPGALAKLALRVEGAEAAQWTGAGIRLETASGPWMLPAIEASVAAGMHARGMSPRRAADGSFTLTAPVVVPLTPADDPAQPGDLLFSTFLGGLAWENARGLRVTEDAVYFVGATHSADFPTTPGAYQSECRLDLCVDGYVARLDVTGSRLEAATLLGGALRDELYGIDVARNGDIVVTGRTTSTDFPTSALAPQRSSGGSNCGTLASAVYCSDAVVSRLDGTGSVLRYSTYLGGDNFEEGRDVALDASGNAYVVGLTASTGFPVTANALDRAWGGGACPLNYGPQCPDGFFTKIDPEGTAWIFSTYLGGSRADFFNSVAIDSLGRPVLTGGSASTDYPVTVKAFQRAYVHADCPAVDGTVPCSDAVITQVRQNLSDLSYSSFLGGGGGETIVGVALDAGGSVYVTGSTTSADFPIAPPGNVMQTGRRGARDVFVTKLHPSQDTLTYSTFFGGSGDDFGGDIAVGTGDQAYVLFSTMSPELPGPAAPGYDPTANGMMDAAIARFDRTGRWLDYRSFLGGAEVDRGLAIGLNSAGSAYVAGYTESPDFPVTAGSFDGTFGEPTCGDATAPYPCQEAFVAKFAFGVVPTATPPRPTAAVTPSATPTPSASPEATPIEVGTPTETPDDLATRIAATLTALAPGPSMTPTPDDFATRIAATLTALAPRPTATWTPDAVGTIVAATLTALAPTATVPPTADRVQTAVAATLTALAPPPGRWRVYLPWALRGGSEP